MRRIARAWRRLTGGSERRLPDGARRTLLAVSGGADSLAMLLALASASGGGSGGGRSGGGDRGGGIGGVAHVVHDLRPASEAEADRDEVGALATDLGLPFYEGVARVDPSDNAERSAREARYRVLEALAARAGCRFVATAHHADDQLESMVMGLIRGAGPEGLRGIAPSRPLSDTVTLIRPCLGITSAEARAICRDAGLTWREDATNDDTTRLRAALRHGPLAALTELRPGSARAAARAAGLLRDTAGLIRDHAETVFGDRTCWSRAKLRAQRGVVLGAGLRRAALRLTGGRHADALTSKTLDPAIRAIRDASTEPRRFDWPGGLTLRVTAREVSLTR